MEGSGGIRKGRGSWAGCGAGEGRAGRSRPPKGRARGTSASPGPGVASRPHHHHLPPHSPLRPGDGEGAQPGGRQAGGPRNEAADQRPGESRAAPAPVGTSTRRGRGLASITADLSRPPCWEETTRHAAAERLQRRKRRRRRWLPRAAAAPGGRGRRAAREERLEPQRYGGLAGPRLLPRSPAGRRGAWRASCGAALGASRSDDPRRRRSRRADAAPGSAAGASQTFQSAREWARAQPLPPRDSRKHPQGPSSTALVPPAAWPVLGGTVSTCSARLLNLITSCTKLLDPRPCPPTTSGFSLVKSTADLTRMHECFITSSSP